MYNDDSITVNKSFSGVDMVATCQIEGPDGYHAPYTLGELQTLTYSLHMDRRPIRSIGNINAKDYVLGPRTIAGTLIFAVFNRHFASQMIKDINTKYDVKNDFLADELPPFSITVSFANEYGAQARLVLYGIRLVNEGQVMSVNDIYTENTYQFVALDIEYLSDQTDNSSDLSSKTDKKYIYASAAVDNTSPGSDINSALAATPAITNTALEIVTLEARQLKYKESTNKCLTVFSMIPKQKNGILTISGSSLVEDIQIDVGEYPDMPIYESLSPGEYKVQYKNQVPKKSSEEKTFFLHALYAQEENVGKAPLIEYVSSTAISVYTNNLTHDRLRYSIDIQGEDPIWEEIPINGRKILINNLKENAAYMLYTLSDESESQKVDVVTRTNELEPYVALKSFVRYNKSLLSYGSIDDYESVIDQARAIDIDFEGYVPVANAIALHKDNLNSELSLESDIEEKGILNNKIKMCCQLIIEANKLENNNIESFNMNTSHLEAPEPEMMDTVNGIFLVDQSVNTLHFYRQNGNVFQFVKSAESNLFYNHLSGKKAYAFSGAPGYNYQVHAFDGNMRKSTNMQFYIMTDTEKSSMLEEFYQKKSVVSFIKSNKELELQPRLTPLGLTIVNKDRVVLQESKTPDSFIFASPVILEKTDRSLSVVVTVKEVCEQFEQDLYLVICKADEALYGVFTYKKLIEEEPIEFNTVDGGVRPDSTYLLWIENNDGLQVSPSISVVTCKTMNEEQLIQDEKVSLFYIQNILEKIKTAYGKRGLMSEEIKTCINNLAEDNSVTWSTIFERIAKNILEYSPKLSNVNSKIESLYRIKSDLLYLTDEHFFDKVTFNPEMHSLKISAHSEEYMLSAMYLTSFGSLVKTYGTIMNQENEILLDRDSTYVIIHAVSKDMLVKSGIIFINTMGQTASGYRIEIGV